MALPPPPLSPEPLVVWCAAPHSGVGVSRRPLSQAVAADVRAGAWGALYARDQLHQQVASGRALFGFDDGGPLPFAPTFKLATDEAKGRRLIDGDANAPLYDNRRAKHVMSRRLMFPPP